MSYLRHTQKSQFPMLKVDLAEAGRFLYDSGIASRTDSGPSVIEVLTTNGWRPTLDTAGNITGITYAGNDEDDEAVNTHDLFNALARFVPDGSYVEMEDDYNGVFVWTFHDGACEEALFNLAY